MSQQRPARIYTRMGDEGETGMFGGPRLSKDAARVEACGNLDELNSALGLVRAEPLPEEMDRLLERVQHELFAAGAELAAAGAVGGHFRTIGPDHICALEQAIDRYDRQLPPIAGFILPCGTRAAAAAHLARTVCRRAERRLVGLARADDKAISPHLRAYLNRLSDLLFVLARSLNAEAGLADAPWQKEPPT